MIGKTVTVGVTETIAYEVEVPTNIAREGDEAISEYCLSELSLSDIESTAYVSNRTTTVVEAPDLDGDY